jgi:PAS domain S-box-containing protein
MHFGMRPERGRPGREHTRLLEAVARRAAGALASARLVAEVGRARRRFERILDVLGEAVTVRDADGRLVYANDAAARLLGAPTREALLGAGLRGVIERLELTRADGTPIDLGDLPASRMLEGLPAPPLLMRAVDRESRVERWLLVKVTLLEEDGEPLVVGILEDVTETRRD